MRRIVWSGLLSQLSQFPPVSVQQILAVMQDKVLSLGADVPVSTQAQPFSDAALAQVGLHHKCWTISSMSTQVWMKEDLEVLGVGIEANCLSTCIPYSSEDLGEQLYMSKSALRRFCCLPCLVGER